jgi:hypothetical protein
MVEHGVNELAADRFADAHLVGGVRGPGNEGQGSKEKSCGEERCFPHRGNNPLRV